MSGKRIEKDCMTIAGRRVGGSAVSGEGGGSAVLMLASARRVMYCNAGVCTYRGRVTSRTVGIRCFFGTEHRLYGEKKRNRKVGWISCFLFFFLSF